MPLYAHSLSSKLPKTGTTIFSVMSGLAKEHNAINLSQGFPNFPVDPILIELVHKYMLNGYNQYAPLEGVPELREAICTKVFNLYGTQYNPQTEITITAGATQAIYTAISAIIHEGDEVIMFTPAYDCYEPAIELNGGKLIYVQLAAPKYKIDWNEVKKLVTRKTRLIILNTPHNPTGTILTKEDMNELSKIVADTNIVILGDEVYEHIIFDGNKHESLCKYETLVNQSFIIASFGKTFSCTGWKLGYCLAPENLMKEFKKIHQFLVFVCNTPMQYAIAEFIQDKENYINLAGVLQKKRDKFLSLIKGSGFKPLPCSGTYFQLLDYSKISNKPDVEFAKKLTIEQKVASIPISVFYHNKKDEHILRFCFAKDDETLEQAAAILKNIN